MNKIKLLKEQERLRQARQSFNLALMTTTTCILRSYIYCLIIWRSFFE
jgi:ABC-type spermidine/putrescine transport system permease subunit I